MLGGLRFLRVCGFGLLLRILLCLPFALINWSVIRRVRGVRFRDNFVLAWLLWGILNLCFGRVFFLFLLLGRLSQMGELQSMSKLIDLRVDTPAAQFVLNLVNLVKGNDCELLHLLNQSILDRQRFLIQKTWFQNWREKLWGNFVQVKGFVKSYRVPGNKRIGWWTVVEVVVIDYKSLLTKRAHRVCLHERFLRNGPEDMWLHRQRLIRSEPSRLLKQRRHVVLDRLW